MGDAIQNAPWEMLSVHGVASTKCELLSKLCWCAEQNTSEGCLTEVKVSNAELVLVVILQVF